jgi:RecA-family ATPase
MNAPAPAPCPNKTDIAAHLYVLFPPAFVHPYPEAWIEIAFCRPHEDLNKAESFSPFDLKTAAEFAERKNRAGYNLYVGAALRHGKPSPSGRASGTNVLEASHAWAEFDKPGDDARISAILKEKDLKQAIAVVTGTRPCLRAHLYFKLDGSGTPDQLKTVNTALKTLLGSDDVQNPDRVMRLAGTVNYPSPEKIERGYVTEIVTLQAAANPRLYRADALIDLTKDAANPYLEVGKLFQFGRSDDELLALLKATCEPHRWHNNMRDVIWSMVDQGWSDSQIRFACASYCDGGYADPDLEPLIKGARNKLDKPDDTKAPAVKPRPEPLPWLDFSNWDKEPVPERQWAIRDRVPLNQVGLFSGEGGTGKSIVELMKDVAHVAGKDWLGSLPEPGPAFYLAAEDDVDEIHIRLAAIAKHYGVTFKELTEGGLHVLPLLGEDAVLCAVSNKSGRVEKTGLYDQIYEAAGDLKPFNISIDTLSRAFAGNEIDRVQVYAFAMHMQALAKAAGGSVTVLSHPSLTGIATGSGISGSTAWHGAFRFRQYLKGVKVTDGEQPEDNLREFEFKKNQYGPLAQSIVLRYQNGLFLPEKGVSSLDKLARDAKADEVFMELLRRFSDQGRNVSHNKNATNYAPKVFADETDAKRHNLRPKADLEPAMRRLFAADKIFVEDYGRPSRHHFRLSVKAATPAPAN